MRAELIPSQYFGTCSNRLSPNFLASARNASNAPRRVNRDAICSSVSSTISFTPAAFFLTTTGLSSCKDKMPSVEAGLATKMGVTAISWHKKVKRLLMILSLGLFLPVNRGELQNSTNEATLAAARACRSSLSSR